MLTLEFANKLPPEVPSKMKVFSLEKARVDKNVFVNIFSRLGLMRGPDALRWRKSDGWTSAESADTRVSINHRSGAIRFWTRLNDRELPQKPFAIEEPRVISIARSFLKKTGFVDAPAEELKVHKVAYLRMQTATVKGKVTSTKVLDAGVIFGREVERVPVSGPGGHVMINVGPDAAVIAGTKVWRRLGSAIGLVNVLQPDYAIKELSRRLRLEKMDQPVRVVKAEFCYFERGQSDEQNYLEPAYAFVYEYETKKHRFPCKQTLVIPAIQGSKQNWNPPKRF